MDVTESDHIRKVASALSSGARRAVTGTADGRDPAAVDLVAARIAAARRVEISGGGGSGGTGAEFRKRLYRIGLPACASSDGHAALTGAALLGPRAAVVAVSHSGRTRETADPAAEAASRGALTVAVTNGHDAPLARTADIALVTSVRVEGRTGTVLARHARLAVVDLLPIAVAQRAFDRTPRAMAATTEAASQYKHAPGTGNRPRTGKVSGTGSGNGYADRELSEGRTGV